MPRATVVIVEELLWVHMDREVVVEVVVLASLVVGVEEPEEERV
jgi:hypothetical protein